MCRCWWMSVFECSASQLAAQLMCPSPADRTPFTYKAKCYKRKLTDVFAQWEWHQFCVTTRFLHALKKITKNDATVQMFGVGNVFFLNVSYAHQCCIHCILHFKTTVFYLFYLNILKNVAIFSCDLKSWIFSCHYSSFQCHMITFTFMHLADAFIQSDLQTILFFSVCVFPGNWTHNLLRC